MPPSKDRKRPKLDPLRPFPSKATKKKLKDKAELELESLVFGGDDEAQVKGIWERAGHELSDGEEDDEEDEKAEGGSSTEQGLANDLFFFDSGPTPSVLASANDDNHVNDEGGPAQDSDNNASSEAYSSDEEDGAAKERLRPETYRYGRPPAWVDDDDKTLRVSLASEKRLRKLRGTEDEDMVLGVDYEMRLRRQFEKIYPAPNWATLPSLTKAKAGRKRLKHADAGSDSDYSEEEKQRSGSETENEEPHLLRSTQGILRKGRQGALLPQGELEIARMKNANQMGYSQSTVSSVSFHPNAQVVLTSGLDKTLRLFQIDGKINPKIQSVHLTDMPVRSSAFHPSGATILATGRRKYFYIYDVQSGRVDKNPGIYGREDKSLEKFSISPCGRYIAFLGRDGYVVLVSYKTKQWIANLKMNNSVRSVAWGADGEKLWSVGGDAEVYQWDLRTRECVKRWADNGGFKPCVMAVSENEEYYAVGSRTGIVNIYDRSCTDPLIAAPRPRKSITNLTTSIHAMRFNHDAQMLGLASRSKKDQFKLVHLPSMTVFSNWPTSGTPLSYVNCFDFSPGSGYLAIGNDKGRVLLYRMGHYPSA